MQGPHALPQWAVSKRASPDRCAFPWLKQSQLPCMRISTHVAPHGAGHPTGAQAKPLLQSLRQSLCCKDGPCEHRGCGFMQGPGVILSLGKPADELCRALCEHHSTALWIH